MVICPQELRRNSPHFTSK